MDGHLVDSGLDIVDLFNQLGPVFQPRQQMSCNVTAARNMNFSEVSK
jgi:hypothetical protein